eukprot:TRINITY_DN382_c0_g4_i3.p1 TRINITY_DN382_c0_g4~~TRINITY_DN382_c0_g4_i3.p1  ORF type:complete len:287 (+),score=41.25 TRINITY_DN382_c0_g4_i3:143-1003(+)
MQQEEEQETTKPQQTTNRQIQHTVPPSYQQLIHLFHTHTHSPIHYTHTQYSTAKMGDVTNQSSFNNNNNTNNQQNSVRLCKHPNHSEFACLIHALKGFARGFALGYGIRGAIALITALVIKRLYRNPKKLIQSSILHPDVIRFGLFLGTYTGTLKGVNCLLRYLRKREDGWNAIIAGSVAGLSMYFSKSNEIALYLFARALESIFNALHKRGIVPSFKHGDSVLFAVCTSIMFYAFAWEPEALRPSYRKFITNASGGRDYDREKFAPLLAAAKAERDEARRRRTGK